MKSRFVRVVQSMCIEIPGRRVEEICRRGPDASGGKAEQKGQALNGSVLRAVACARSSRPSRTPHAQPSEEKYKNERACVQFTSTTFDIDGNKRHTLRKVQNYYSSDYEGQWRRSLMDLLPWNLRECTEIMQESRYAVTTV